MSVITGVSILLGAVLNLINKRYLHSHAPFPNTRVYGCAIYGSDLVSQNEAVTQLRVRSCKQTHAGHGWDGRDDMLIDVYDGIMYVLFQIWIDMVLDVYLQVFKKPEEENHAI